MITDSIAPLESPSIKHESSMILTRNQSCVLSTIIAADDQTGVHVPVTCSIWHI